MISFSKAYSYVVAMFRTYFIILAAIGIPGVFQKVNSQHLEFQRLSEREKFLQGAVLSICQDTTGFIWLGTRLGLYRYDGHTLKEFRHAKKDSNSLSHNYVVVTFCDRDGRLWIGTHNGLNLLDQRTGRFSRQITDPSGTGKRINRINCIYRDRKNRLWAGTDGGLILVQDTSLSIQKHFTYAQTGGGLAGDTVKALMEDFEGNLWIGTHSGLSLIPAGNQQNQIIRHPYSPELAVNQPAPINTLALDQTGRLWAGTSLAGLFIMNMSTRTFQPFSPQPGSPAIIHSNIRKMICDRQGKLWVGTQEGLSIVDPIQMRCTNYQHDPENNNSLSQNSIHDIMEDDAGSIWIGTYFGGANMVYAFSTPFKTVQYKNATSSISNNVVSSFAEDTKKNLWIATEGGGVNYWNKKENRFQAYKFQPGNEASLASNLVKALYLENGQTLWIGTHGGGLNKLNTATGTIERIKGQAGKGAIDVTSILKDSYSRLWVGTEQNGILLFDAPTKSFRNYLNQPRQTFALSSNYIKAIYQDRRNNIWVATENGLELLENGSERFTRVLPSGTDSSDEMTVNCLAEDSKGNLWVGTQSKGIWMLTTGNWKIKKAFNEADGLAGNAAYGIVQDRMGYLWISTDNGLSRMDPETNFFTNFRTADGLPGNAFNNLAFLKDSEGVLYFGGFQGLTWFSPESIQVNDKMARTVFTGLQIGHEEITPGDASGILPVDMNSISELNLSYLQNIFTVRFANLNFIKSGKNQYSWMLEGYDNQWHTGYQPSATFTNLKPGTYTLWVKGSNNDGQWHENPVKLKIRIEAAPWATWWAYLIYLFIAGTGAFFVLRFLWLRARFRRETAMQQFKLDFFTSISHEIRTHLSLIIGPVERLLLGRQDDPELNNHLIHIKKNADRLLSLVNEMMDLRRAETNNITLHKTQENLVVFLREILSSIESAAQGKQIHVQFSSAIHNLPAYFDKVQLEKVFFNLLTNALKFTPEGGTITMSVSRDEKEAIITVTDNGIGISPEHIEKVFKSYYQVHNGQTSHMGYGIGLALAKALVTLHQGNLEVESAPAQKGKEGQTTFTVRLPLNMSEKQAEGSAVNIANTAKEEPETLFIENQLPPKPHILIIEDNDDLRHFLVESFQAKYHISQADSGEDGLTKATEQIPDLVVCDIMLPGRDGLSVCTQLKNDEKTSHIPVILLTAKVAPEQQLSGMHSGADAYITKPFSLQMLDLQVNNLLSSRAAMRQRYAHQVTLEPRNIDITNADEEFLNRLIAIIEENMEHPDFGVHMLRTEMAMSLTVLYKKIQALTGLSVNDFIKSIKASPSTGFLRTATTP